MRKQTEALKLALYWIEGNGKYDAAKRIAQTIREALAEESSGTEQAAQDDPCIKCKGLGYYDEGHECDDGSMAGGNYVECDKCKQPDFIKHEVENAYDWSEWVCPDPESYLMKCCDCGLVHEAQFRVAKYKPAPSDECEVVSDPDLQAQFRMRRSEQWSPEDTAHRSGGLPMAEQPAQHEFPLRGILASELKCWHRLTEDEQTNLLAFVRNMPAKPAQNKEPCGWRKKYNGEWAYSFTEDAWDFIRIAQPAQPDMNLNCKSVQARLAASWGYVKAEQPAQQEHFDHKAAANAALRDAQNRSYQVAKSTQPAQPAQPLTGEQIRALWEQEAKPERSTAHFFTAFARAIEAAHGIKGDA